MSSLFASTPTKTKRVKKANAESAEATDSAKTESLISAKKGRKRKLPVSEEELPGNDAEPPPPPPPPRSSPASTLIEQQEETEDGTDVYIDSFAGCGLCEWVQESCKAMGFRKPTPVQRECIPAILQGRDVIGCAETGSGKTAAFALPILHELSRDPFGIFALIITPTRELAIQIGEQFAVLGSAMSLRHCVIIGGQSMMAQSLQLSQRPHVVVATPGRLRDHLQGPSPPSLKACRYLVLDEADRLMATSFQSELKCVTAALSQRRQTLLFSATMTDNLQALESVALTRPLKFDLTKTAALPAGLEQEYLFMPQRMKLCWLVQALRAVGHPRLLTNSRAGGNGDNDDDEDDEEEEGSGRLARSIIIFASSCKSCQELMETLVQLGIGPSVCLHSMLTQGRRLAALGKFKSSLANILIATDVASRGLDIPEVDLVINYDMPRIATDYVHRVGRTARAGRSGHALSLVNQFEVELVLNVEAYTGAKLALCEDVVEEDVLPILNAVAKASRVAKMRLLDQGFDEELAKREERKKRSKAKRASASDDNDKEG